MDPIEEKKEYPNDEHEDQSQEGDDIKQSSKSENFRTLRDSEPKMQLDHEGSSSKSPSKQFILCVCIAHVCSDPANPKGALCTVWYGQGSLCHDGDDAVRYGWHVRFTYDIHARASRTCLLIQECIFRMFTVPAP